MSVQSEEAYSSRHLGYSLSIRYDSLQPLTLLELGCLRVVVVALSMMRWSDRLKSQLVITPSTGWGDLMLA